MRDRIKEALHIGVKRTMAMICSDFTYDMEVVSHRFVSNITKPDAKNEERHQALIDNTEGPGERLAVLFKLEVLPPE